MYCKMIACSRTGTVALPEYLSSFRFLVWFVIDIFKLFSICRLQLVSQLGTAYPSGAPEFISVFSGVRVTQSLVLYVCFVNRCLSFCSFSFGHCVGCSSSIYRFWLRFWYLQALLKFNQLDLNLTTIQYLNISVVVILCSVSKNV